MEEWRSIQRQSRVAVAAAIFLAGAVLLVGILVSPLIGHNGEDDPSLVQLKKHPEAQLYYPGARVVQTDIRGESPAMELGPIPAHASALIASSASPEQVMSWYRDYLTKHGWTEVGLGSFRRASEVFVVVTSNPGLYRVVYAVRECRVFGGTLCFGS